MRFVLDNSVCMAWFFADEANNYTTGVLESLATHTCLVPSLWSLEVANVLLMGQRRGRCSEADCARFSALLAALPITTDHRTAEQALHDIFRIARLYRLTAYHAAYLELAIREGVPLATQDKALRQAAQESGSLLFNF
mgnify:CR=1 FL=1